MYEQLVGSRWGSLPASVRAVHAPGVVAGTLAVVRGRGLLARLLGFLMRLPAAGAAVPVRLEIEVVGDRLEWRRCFGGDTLVSRHCVRDGLLLEAFGPFVCAFELDAGPRGLVYRQRRFGLRLGPWSLWLPRWLCPRVQGRCEASADGPATVCVQIDAPLLGIVLGYEGELG